MNNKFDATWLNRGDTITSILLEDDMRDEINPDVEALFECVSFHLISTFEKTKRGMELIQDAMKPYPDLEKVYDILESDYGEAMMELAAFTDGGREDAIHFLAQRAGLDLSEFDIYAEELILTSSAADKLTMQAEELFHGTFHRADLYEIITDFIPVPFEGKTFLEELSDIKASLTQVSLTQVSLTQTSLTQASLTQASPIFDTSIVDTSIQVSSIQEAEEDYYVL